MQAVKSTIQFDNYFVVDGIGRNGGLALLWKQDLNIHIQSFFKWHINGMVTNQSNGN